MSIDRRSASTPFFIVIFRSDANLAGPYLIGKTQLDHEDGKYVDFGIWHYSNPENSTLLPGSGTAIGYIKEINAPTTEVHFMDASIYF